MQMLSDFQEKVKAITEMKEKLFADIADVPIEGETESTNVKS